LRKTALVYAPGCLEHKTGRGHPESAERLRVILRELKRSGLLESGKCSLVEPEPASREDLELVHDPEYIRLLKRYCAAGGGLLDLGDTLAGPGSFGAALLAVGGAVRAVDLVMEGRAGNAFALVRPPGHHAGANYTLGFCLLNNVAVAAAHLIHRFGLDRVLILDVDAHHGNGTQEAFYGTSRVLYVSLHGDSAGFPGTGFIDEVGEGDGAGHTVNVPLPPHADDGIYLEALDRVVVPVARQYRPRFILLSAGFDGHHTDRAVADLSLSAHAYPEVFGRALDLASSLSEGRLATVLEGGYSLRFLGRMVTAAIAKMAGVTYRLWDRRPTASSKTRRRAERIIEEVIHVQSSYWKL